MIASEPLSYTGALLFLAAVPVSLEEPQCVFVFGPSGVKTATLRRQLRPGVHVHVHF